MVHLSWKEIGPTRCTLVKKSTSAVITQQQAQQLSPFAVPHFSHLGHFLSFISSSSWVSVLKENVNFLRDIMAGGNTFRSFISTPLSVSLEASHLTNRSNR